MEQKKNDTISIIPVHRHAAWHQRIKSHHLTLAVSYNLGIGIAPQEQVSHDRFPENKAYHLRVRLIMQYKIQRMIHCFFLTAAVCVSVKVQRQSCYRLRQNTDVGIYCSHLHSRTLISPFACSTATHEKPISTARRAFFWIIPATK